MYTNPLDTFSLALALMFGTPASRTS